ncbi:IclR family transcriptional regulator [Roseomonas populi]|uniref:Helix-turn-helix domain-containing protein n=1 Tax=Roseomonas populi TaxID=3121582 RepID=A0ABT1WY81_9PROT|nr:helix-turn-helix domain-containing protein [Roseomonas pecuniae]MCR0980795.1 helix-turn-helix domain-containing protein [Roseomonas pecuniae]
MRAKDGVGAIEKACRVLKAMSDGRNTRLTEISAHCGLDKATALRVLEILAREGLVVRDLASKRYALGPEVARIARGVGEPVDWSAVVRPSLQRLAGQFEDTALASVVSGLEMVCVDLQVGQYPLRAQFQEVGSRRTLGVGSSGMSVLAAMPLPERSATLRQIERRLSQYPAITPALIEETIGRAEGRGYAVLVDAVVVRMGGIAAVVRAPGGRPIGALSVAALAERILDREAALAAAVMREAAEVEARLAAMAPADFVW